MNKQWNNARKSTYFMMAVLCLACTSNPVGDSDISFGKREMSGRVQLENEHSPEGVYVWLEGFDVGTFTTEDGSFTLTLPRGFDDISGVFRVYFYVSNYLLEFVEVAVLDGQFTYGEGALDTGGEMRETVTLRQFLSIKAYVSPETVTRVNNMNVTMTFSLGLQALIDTSTVILPNTIPGFLSSVYFKNTDTGELFIFQGLSFTTKEVLLVGKSTVIREMDVSFLRINLPAGKYRFIPYILIRHEAIPAELIDSIAMNVLEFGANYPKLPSKQDGGYFEVKE